MKDKSQNALSISHISPQVRKIITQFVDETKQLLKDNIIAEYLFGSYATNT